MNRIKFLRIIFVTTFVVSMLMSIILSLPENWGKASALQTDDIKSKSYCLIDQNSGQILLEKDSLKHLPIASVTKTMTLLLTFEAVESGKLSYDQMFVCSKKANSMGGSQVFLDTDAQYKLDDLLYSVVLSSANDSSVMLAEAISGSEESFVDVMNQKAKSLGLENTNFVNCTGLPANDHYSCAYDVAIIMKELVKHKDYFKYTKERLRDFVHPSGRITQMTNTNKLINNYNGCDAGKTGSTAEAGYCLSATALRNNMRLVSVVLGAETSKQRFLDCQNMFDYGFNNFESKCIISQDKQIFAKSIKQAKDGDVFVVPSHAVYQTVKKGEQTTFDTKFEYFDVSAPLKSGDVVGKIYLTDQNKVCDEIDLILCDDIEQKTYFENIKSILYQW